MKIRDFIISRSKRLFKKIILSREEKKIGGNPRRTELRSQRLDLINKTKKLIKDDLINSWNLGEIRSPDEEDWDIINTYHKRIPISSLNTIKEKYWGGNIYGEL
jgi:hypothetical protein